MILLKGFDMFWQSAANVCCWLSMFAYLKIARQRCKQHFVENGFEQYRCASTIVSPEARKGINRKLVWIVSLCVFCTLHAVTMTARQNIVTCLNRIVVDLRPPRRRRENYLIAHWILLEQRSRIEFELIAMRLAIDVCLQILELIASGVDSVCC